jgi:hypothetical protein
VSAVEHLFRSAKRGWPLEELPEIKAPQDVRVEGCAHGRPGSKRQALLVDCETLDALELVAGMITVEAWACAAASAHLAAGSYLPWLFPPVRLAGPPNQIHPQSLCPE